MAKPLCYIAGPYTNPDPVENTHNVCQIAMKLYEERVCVPIIPHITLLWHLVCPRPYDFWLAYDLETMAHCDVVLRIEGESSGADGEVRAAQKLGIPVVSSINDLKIWSDEWQLLQ